MCVCVCMCVRVPVKRLRISLGSKCASMMAVLKGGNNTAGRLSSLSNSSCV